MELDSLSANVASDTYSRKSLETKKDHIGVDVRAVPSSEGSTRDLQWETGVRARFPWIGFLAIMTMLLGIVGTGLVLFTSNGKSQQEWPSYERWSFVRERWRQKAQLEPHVFLAIINTVTNLALAIAIAHGVAINWWRRALQGSTVAELHKSWGFATSVLELLTAGRKFNLIALAALTAKLALVDNVLLQRATSTAAGYQLQPGIDTRLPMVSRLPPDYTGKANANLSTISAAFSLDIEAVTGGALLKANDFYYPFTYSEFNTGCDGICQTYFEGFGFEWDCPDPIPRPQYTINPELAILTTTGSNSSEAAILYENPLLEVSIAALDANQTWYEGWEGGDLPSSIANQSLPVPWISMQILYASVFVGNSSDSSTCTSSTMARFCSLRPAILNYSMQITNITNEKKIVGVDMSTDTNGISYVRNPDPAVGAPGKLMNGQFDGVPVISTLPYDASDTANIQNFAAFLDATFSTYVILNYIEGKDENSTRGYYAPNVKGDGHSYSNFGQYWLNHDPSESCEINVYDPYVFIGEKLNALTSLSSMRAATDYVLHSPSYGSIDEKNIQTYANGDYLNTLFYETTMSYGVAAMAIVFLCVLLVLPSYWKFWELGRKVTLGPMEIANAFQSPVLHDPEAATNGEASQLVKAVGSREIQYGVVDGHRLGVAGPSAVSRV